jgi:hypothetical protein
MKETVWGGCKTRSTNRIRATHRSEGMGWCLLRVRPSKHLLVFESLPQLALLHVLEYSRQLVERVVGCACTLQERIRVRQEEKEAIVSDPCHAHEVRVQAATGRNVRLHVSDEWCRSSA